MDGLTYLDPTEKVATTGPPGDPRREHASSAASNAGTENGAGGTEQRPIGVFDVLGPESVPEIRRPWWSVFESVIGPVRDGLAVLVRPRVAGVLVTGLGILILLLLGYIYVFTPLTAQRAQHQLLSQITSEPARAFSLAEGKLPAKGSPVAVLEIPSLHLVDAVVQGTDAQDLRNGPGHMPTTPLPGQRGNAVIAGKRATYGGPFSAIGTLKKGQLIKVIDGFGTYRYQVTAVLYARGGKHDVVTPTPTNMLTLVTASSGFFPSGRLAVRARLVGKPFTATPVPRFHVVPAQLGLADDPASAVLALLWIITFFVLLSATAWLLRNWSQPVVICLLAVPVLLVTGLFVCESIVGFLPATV